MTPSNEVPRWDLSDIYPSLESPEIQADMSSAAAQIDELDHLFNQRVAAVSLKSEPQELADLSGELLQRFINLGEVVYTLYSYLYSVTSTDSYNQLARKLKSQSEQLYTRMQELTSRFNAFVGLVAPLLPEILKLNEVARQHAFMLQEAAKQSKFLMTPAEESLSAELSQSGLLGWSKLQAVLVSQTSIDFELDGKSTSVPLPQIINLRSHPDREVRRKAYQAELKACQGMQEPLASALNGVKGYQLTVDRRRGRPGPLHASLEKTRLDQASLDAMLSAMQDSLPDFRRYFRSKARRLGNEKLAWYDLFAPMGQADRKFTYPQACQFIFDNFERFSPDLSNFARQAVENNWIDAQPRPGKQGGAYCIDFPAVRQPRVFLSFDGSLNEVSTLAHELGHAFHADCIFKSGKDVLQGLTPMTLAETASIMNETIVQQAALSQATSKEEELAILETALINDSQVIVDIYSRFLFEKEIFARRAKAELSADEFCEVMAWAQKQAYGDALDQNSLHPYMWTWKEHYYGPGIQFYNFPYAFGLLFGLGLYAIYQQRGDSFVPDYKNLLASTGEAYPADLAARFGIDIRSKRFWEDSLKIISGLIDRYEKIEANR